MNRALAAILTALFLAGCPRAPTNIEVATPPDAAALDLGGMADIVVVRPGIMAFAVSFGVWVDDLSVGEIRSNDYVHQLVEPGIVTVKATAERNCYATFPAEADHRYFLQAKPKPGWWYARVQLELIDPETGARAVLQCEDQTR